MQEGSAAYHRFAVESCHSAVDINVQLHNLAGGAVGMDSILVQKIESQFYGSTILPSITSTCDVVHC